MTITDYEGIDGIAGICWPSTWWQTGSIVSAIFTVNLTLLKKTQPRPAADQSGIL